MIEVEPLFVWTDDGWGHDGLRWRPEGDICGTVVHIHGMAGHYTENPWVHTLARSCVDAGWAFIAGAHRGTGVIRQALRAGSPKEVELCGAALELVEQAPLDTAAWVTLAEGPVVLSGHSLGGPKVVLSAVCGAGVSPARLAGTVLLSPADMVRYTQAIADFHRLSDEADRALAQGQPHRILPSSWQSMPISAATFYERAERGRPADVIDGRERPGKTPLSRLSVPALAIMGDLDDDLGNDTARGLASLHVQCPSLLTHLIAGSDHQYHGHVNELCDTFVGFLATL